MVCETTKRNPLLPDRRQQGDFFLCDIFDAAPKGDMASMEHPVFSISTKPDLKPRRYENGNSFIEITPSVKGLATIHDRDVLIFCISQIMSALNEGKAVSQTVRFAASDLLTATNRPNGGESYDRLKQALERLGGTQISTNITTGGEEVLDIFTIIDKARIVRQTRDGRMQEIEITLSDWVFNAINAKEVLTLSRDYFRLRRPLERRLYEIARKHCGVQREWKISLEKLRTKCGSASSLKEFRRLLSGIIEKDRQFAHMPDYSIDLDGEFVWFKNRGSVPQPVVEIFDSPLPSFAHEDARSAAPGWDPRHLEQEWRMWCGGEEIEPKHPLRHFIKFCTSWYEKRGAPR
ncbi:replication initiator protein A [Marinobacter alexandrii]|uniref:replication initiator protein A n=1 Tax=Marinobacter alexandrii TaxID=2570351 RepID=UPI0032729B27